MFGIRNAIRGLLTTYLDHQKEEADRWRKTLETMAAQHTEQLRLILEAQKLQLEMREVGGLPKDMAERRAMLEERRLKLEEDEAARRAQIHAAALARNEEESVLRKMQRDQQIAIMNGSAAGPILPVGNKRYAMTSPEGAY